MVRRDKRANKRNDDPEGNDTDRELAAPGQLEPSLGRGIGQFVELRACRNRFRHLPDLFGESQTGVRHHRSKIRNKYENNISRTENHGAGLDQGHIPGLHAIHHQFRQTWGGKNSLNNHHTTDEIRKVKRDDIDNGSDRILQRMA